LLPTTLARKLDQHYRSAMSDRGGHIMRRKAIVLAAAVALTPLGARAADLVVWWEQGFYPQADEALAEIVAAFEQRTGKRVELVQIAQDEVYDRVQASLGAGQPPDFLFGTTSESWAAQWAYDDQLTDLGGTLGPVLNLFDADVVAGATMLNGKTGRRGLYVMPMARGSNHIHVWSSLLQSAGFTLADVPRDWGAFWSFWCDEVQPAVRQALGRDDIWGVGLPMSVAAVSDTFNQLEQFQLAYEASWLGLDRRLRVDDPEIRAGMVLALSDYTAIWRKGCTPPDAVTWTNLDNNKAFLAKAVVMTTNTSLSIPATLRTVNTDDYYANAVTIDWPDGANGQPLVIYGFLNRAVVFKAGRNPALAHDFVRFLAEDGWLAHWLDFAGDQFMPPMRELVERPFWLDPTDPHRMHAAVQILSRAHYDPTLGVRDQEWRSPPIFEENVWAKAVRRVVSDGISPEQAVDEAIARIKQILSE
jgi:multiple sugar transport system substrate-binding protein